MEFSFINIYYDLKTQPLCLLLISSLGFLSLLKSSVSLLKWLYVIFLRPPKNLVKSYGSWALITGSTDGIGKAFAFQLARKGLNLILVGRNMEKLEHVSSAIQAKYPDTKVEVVVLDFSKDLTVGIHELEKEIVQVDVGVLINNVGVTYPKATYFHEIEEDVWMNLVRVNVEGTSRVTRSVVKGMVERKRGAIVNIGSGAAIIVPSHPLFAVYAATKAYVDQLSRCMFVEYKDWGIDVQCQVPLYVATSMTSRVASIEKSSLFVPSADDYAQAAVHSIGYETRCTPFWAHSVQWYFAHLLPDFVLDAWRLSIGIHRKGLQGKPIKTLNTNKDAEV